MSFFSRNTSGNILANRIKMNIQEYIDSGVIKMYVLGYADVSEKAEIESLIEKHPELKEELLKVEEELFQYTSTNKVEPHPSLQPLVLASLDYIKRLESGEEVVDAPILNKTSSLSDFKLWIDRADFVAPSEFEEIHAKIICANPNVTCAMVWIKNMATEEIHTDEHERFLIVEGTCTIRVGEEFNKLVPGDYFEIPLHLDHEVIVTSKIPCKVILQRVAA